MDATRNAAGALAFGALSFAVWAAPDFLARGAYELRTEGPVWTVAANAEVRRALTWAGDPQRAVDALSSLRAGYAAAALEVERGRDLSISQAVAFVDYLKGRGGGALRIEPVPVLPDEAAPVETPPIAPTLPEILPQAPAAAPPAAPNATPLPSRPDAVAPPRPRIAPAPNVFGFVAVPVHRSPLQARWRRVLAAGDGASLTPLGLASGAAVDRSDLAAQVNRWVNRNVAYAQDQSVYGRRDYWATIAETLGKRRGDCEDFAVAKMHLLAAAGVPTDEMYLVLVWDVVQRADHAVLLLRDGDRFLVLDSRTDAVLPAESVRDYRPVLSFNNEQLWTHGGRLTRRTVPAADAPSETELR